MRSENSCEGRWTAVSESRLSTMSVPSSLFFDHSSVNFLLHCEADLILFRFSKTVLDNIRMPPTQKRQETISPRKTVPRVAVNTISLVIKRPLSQLLQYWYPWFIKSWASIEVAAIPPAIIHSIPDAGMIGSAIYTGIVINAPSRQK